MTNIIPALREALADLAMRGYAARVVMYSSEDADVVIYGAVELEWWKIDDIINVFRRQGLLAKVDYVAAACKRLPAVAFHITELER